MHNNKFIQRVMEAPVQKKIYEVDANTTYICYPLNSTIDVGDALWKVLKISKSGIETTFAFADGNEEYDNVAKNYATLTYPTFAE
jgi:hypothetical protein